jgi:hypothetical protein
VGLAAGQLKSREALDAPYCTHSHSQQRSLQRSCQLGSGTLRKPPVNNDDVGSPKDGAPSALPSYAHLRAVEACRPTLGGSPIPSIDQPRLPGLALGEGAAIVTPNATPSFS